MIILDANAIIKLVIREEGSQKAEKEVTKAIENGDILAAPEIALAETLNAVWKHFSFAKDINKKELNEIVVNLLFMWNRIIKLETQKLSKQAVDTAVENNLNMYDSLYVVASRLNNAPLLTFDEGIIKKSNELCIKIL